MTHGYYAVPIHHGPVRSAIFIDNIWIMYLVDISLRFGFSVLCLVKVSRVYRYFLASSGLLYL